MFVPVAAGDTLSQIAADNGASLSSVEAANPGITDPNTIYVGQSVVVPTGGSFAQWSPSDSPSTSPSHASVVPSTPSQPSSSGKFFSGHSAGHLGYAGTSLWIDFERKVTVLLITNRTWPDRKSQAIRTVRPVFHDAIYSQLEVTLDRP